MGAVPDPACHVVLQRDGPVKVLHDNEGRPSSMRMLTAASVATALILALGTLAGVGMDDPTALIAVLLSPLAAKVGQKFAENGGK